MTRSTKFNLKSKLFIVPPNIDPSKTHQNNFSISRNILSAYGTKKSQESISIKDKTLKPMRIVKPLRYMSNQFKTYSMKSNILRKALLKKIYKKNINVDSSQVKGALQISLSKRI